MIQHHIILPTFSHRVPYVIDSVPDWSGVVLCNPFKWDILCSFLIKNHLVVLVPSITVKWISFCNRSNRKVVGGKHNVLLLCVDANAPDPSGFVLCKPFKWDILCSFLIENLAIFLPSITTVNQISFRNHSNRKVVGGKHNVSLLYVDAKSTVLSSRFVSSNCR